MVVRQASSAQHILTHRSKTAHATEKLTSTNKSDRSVQYSFFTDCREVRTVRVHKFSRAFIQTNVTSEHSKCILCFWKLYVSNFIHVLHTLQTMICKRETMSYFFETFQVSSTTDAVWLRITYQYRKCWLRYQTTSANEHCQRMIKAVNLYFM